MRPTILALVALGATAVACERPNLGDDSADTGDTGETGDTGDTDTGTDTDTADTDTSDTSPPDTGVDTDTADTADTDTADPSWDAQELYPQGPSCESTLNNQWGVHAKGAGTWAAGRWASDPSVAMTVHQIKFVLRHGTDYNSVVCDSDGAFEMRMMITDNSLPPDGNGSTAPTFVGTASFPAVTLGAVTHRDLVYIPNPPIVVPQQKHFWVAVNGDASSCWQVCKEGVFTDVTNENWFSNEADPVDWDWQNLGTYGFTNDDHVEYMAVIWVTEP